MPHKKKKRQTPEEIEAERRQLMEQLAEIAQRLGRTPRKCDVPEPWIYKQKLGRWPDICKMMGWPRACAPQFQEQLRRENEEKRNREMNERGEER